MKNAICRRPAFRRWRRRACTSASVPSALDIAGSSAADTAMPNRLTGKRVDRLRIGQRGDRALAELAGKHLVHVGADLHHAAADEYRQRSCARLRARWPTCVSRRNRSFRVNCEHDRQLHGELQRAARPPSPRPGRSPGSCRSSSRKASMVRDHRHIPDDRRGVGEEEFAVAIQNAEATTRRTPAVRRRGRECAPAGWSVRAWRPRTRAR